MNIKIAPLLEKARTNFWLIPSVMIFMTLCFAVLAVYIDVTITIKNYPSLSLLYSTDINAMRSLLGTISAAMVTVTSIAFSITIVTLTLASSQFGPRLMRNFMMDTSTQFVLGMFISTFLFCVFIFCAISFNTPYTFKPGVSWLMALGMTCTSVCVLIYFIHHVAKSIQADVVIDNVYCELKKNIDKIFPSSEHQEQVETLDSENSHTKFEDDTYHEIKASTDGYVQLIDQEKLLKLAVEVNIVINLHISPGDFVVSTSVIGVIYSDNEIEPALFNKIEQHIVLGSCRTPVQDPKFAIHQLVEIALRALSPGINDPYTAITCIDKLGSVLCSLTRTYFPSPYTYDSSGKLRLITNELSFTDIANAAFNQIRFESSNNITISIQLLTTLKAIAQQNPNNEQRAFIQLQTRMLVAQQASLAINKHERNTILSHAKQVLSLTNATIC
ncbi:DUF2254 domain-containing protein [Thalassotalea piscium]|uniref:Putative membrane protein n=1 Tax=Thalassotalea piscium TaxID=1230533 RepID=A0A7X0NE28_9GAMM|nr:DUF2254 domain-containing protein [Thalassotalea piscium]MBB6541722.1 putative membrane protein [Thalassotalea piscium]